MDSLTCPLHSTSLISRKNSRQGGIFYGCPCFESHGCKVSYSPTENKWYGLPGKVSRASKLRSGCFSIKELAISHLKAHGLGLEEATTFVAEVGPQAVLELVAA